MKVLSHSVTSNSATPWMVTHQSPLSMGFSRQEDWSGLPFPSPGDLPDPGVLTGVYHIAGRLLSKPPRKLLSICQGVELFSGVPDCSTQFSFINRNMTTLKSCLVNHNPTLIHLFYFWTLHSHEEFQWVNILFYII